MIYNPVAITRNLNYSKACQEGYAVVTTLGVWYDVIYATSYFGTRLCQGDFQEGMNNVQDCLYVPQVRNELEAIDFYCKKCKKSLRISYALTGDANTPAMNGIMIRCHTNKCTRVVTLKNFTEGQILSEADAHGRCYL